MDQNPAQNPTPPPVTQTEAPQPPVVKQSRFSKKQLIITGIVFLVALIVGVGVFLGSSMLMPKKAVVTKISPTPAVAKNTTDITKGVSYSVVYGLSSSDSIEIYTYSIISKTNVLTAKLPKAIKRVSLLSDNSYIFINNTNEYDNGTEISVYSPDTQKIQSLVKADPGFFIDEYSISPDRTSLAIWEISLDPVTKALLNGKSRVYSVNLKTPSVKNLIYDETATETVAVHYPSAILNDGTIYMDTFVTNSGAGWAHGVSVSDFTGTTKEDVSTMTNGTYGTKLLPSPKGDYIVFGGYDGTHGDGVSLQDGFRIATIWVNTIELFDTTSKERMKLPGVSPTSVYANFRWSTDGEVLYFTAIGKDKVVSGSYMYDIPSSKMTKLPIERGSAPIAGITNDLFLSGEPGDGLSSLGYTYAPPFSKISLIGMKAYAINKLAIEQKNILYITTISDISLPVLAAETSTDDSKKTLQLQPYKPTTPTVTTGVVTTPTNSPTPTLSVPDNRRNQQTNPPSRRIGGGGGSGIGSPNNPPGSSTPPLPACRDLYAAQVNAVCGPKPPKPPANASETEKAAQYTLRSEWEGCVDYAIGSHYQDGTCQGTPLYLYGPKGLKTSVKVLTPISNAIPGDVNGLFDITLGEDGKISSKGKEYNSISYDYINALRKITKPTKGYVVTKAQLEKTIIEMSKKLNLNEKEASDLVTALVGRVTSPFVFVSFFDQSTSKKMLPITFSTKPDTYINYVFYMKNLDILPNYSIEEPDFDFTPRTGFTAVEISEMVE